LKIGFKFNRAKDVAKGMDVTIIEEFTGLSIKTKKELQTV